MSVIRCLLTTATNVKTATPPVISSEVEKSPGEQFPIEMKHNDIKPDKKPFANSFLSVRIAMVSSRTGNPSRTVSCRNETEWSQAGQETIRKQFLAGMEHNGTMSNREPFAVPVLC